MVVEASSIVSDIITDSAGASCGSGEANLLITEGESSVALVLRTVPLLVVNSKIGTLGSSFLPIVDEVQQVGHFKWTCKYCYAPRQRRQKTVLDNPQP